MQEHLSVVILVIYVLIFTEALISLLRYHYIHHCDGYLQYFSPQSGLV